MKKLAVLLTLALLLTGCGKTQPVLTETSSAPVETESVPTSVCTEPTKPATQAQTETPPASMETESVPTSVCTEPTKPATQAQTETPPAPMEIESTPTTAHTEPTIITEATAAPTEPTATAKPTAAPTEPTATAKPTAAPTEPTATAKPTAAPTEPTVTAKPTVAATKAPTVVPTESLGTVATFFLPEEYTTGYNNPLVEDICGFLLPPELDAAVDAEVKRILDELDLYDECDANKVFGIYKYICENVTYGDPFDQSLNNVYDALVNKKTICGGYAAAFCRLAAELGVNAIYMPGYAGLGGHAWNIVELDGLYYNLDTTWDAGKYEYKYFLKTQEEFTSHTREAVYDTEEYHKLHPMATEKYCGGSGWIDDRIYWECVGDGKLVFQGTGAIPGYDAWAYTEEAVLAPWHYYREGIKSIEIRDGITEIGQICFYGCTALTTVQMADSVTAIRKSAFDGATALKTIKFSESLEEIGDWAFSNTALEKVILPQSATTIGKAAFDNCTNLTETILPEGLTVINDITFAGCSALTRIRIPAAVTDAGEWTFSGCSSLKEVTISHDTSVGESFFRNCSSLEKVSTYPGEIESLKAATKEMFYGCSSLKSISLFYASVGERAFQDCTSLETVRFENSGTCELDAFKNCTSIKTVYINNRNHYAQINFDNKESNPLHNGAILQDANGVVTHIHYGASWVGCNQYTFYGCKSLTSVHLTGNVEDYAFADCTNLRYVTVLDRGKDFDRTGCATIDEGAFMNCSNLEWMELGDSCYSVHEEAFLNCGKLKTVYLNQDQTKWTKLCQNAPFLKTLKVVLNAKAPEHLIGNLCEDCKYIPPAAPPEEEFLIIDEMWPYI